MASQTTSPHPAESAIMTTLYTLILSFIALFCLFLWRLTGALARPGRNSRNNKPKSTLVVLGSGGHTSEMIALLRGLNGRQYSPVTFVVANTDTTSLERLQYAGAILEGASKDTCLIPRSREVKQGWVSTIFTTAHASLWSLVLVFRLRPNLILANGPGTCVPICLAGVLLRMLGLGNPTIVFVESFCRVRSLSLSGRILYPWADRFIVQWPGLRQRYSRAEFVQNLY